MDQDLVSFVIRFVREAGDDQQARWRGVIKHEQSNGEANFTQFSEALAFMQGFVNDVVQNSVSESKRFTEAYGLVNPFLETTRLWGELMPAYTKTMMEMMGEMMASHLVRIRPEDAAAGDIVWMKIKGAAQHVAILTEHGMIHSSSAIRRGKETGRVVEHRLDSKWRKRIYRAFRFPWVTD